MSFPFGDEFWFPLCGHDFSIMEIIKKALDVMKKVF